MRAGSEVGVRRYDGPACPRCDTEIDPGALISNPVSCPVCLREFHALLFEPPAPDVSIPRVAEAGPGGAHPCGHHPGNVASEHCGRCGVFMCRLCRIDTDGRVLCPACFERLAEGGELPSLVAHYRDYSHMQFYLAVLGLLIIFIGPIAGLASVYYGVKGLKQREAMGEAGGQLKTWVLFALGAVEAVVGVAVLVSMVRI